MIGTIVGPSYYMLPLALSVYHILPTYAITLMLTPGKEIDIRPSGCSGGDSRSLGKRHRSEVGEHVTWGKFDEEPRSTFVHIGGDVIPANRIGNIGCKLDAHILGGPHCSRVAIADREDAWSLQMDGDKRLHQMIGHRIHQRAMRRNADIQVFCLACTRFACLLEDYLQSLSGTSNDHLTRRVDIGEKNRRLVGVHRLHQCLYLLLIEPDYGTQTRVRRRCVLHQSSALAHKQ